MIVDRSSRWGNPFTVEDILADGAATSTGEARAVAVHRFGRWLDGAGPNDYNIRPGRSVSRAWIHDHLKDLAGKVLVCTCPVDELPCHADELARRAAERAVYAERAQLVAYVSSRYSADLSTDPAEPMCPGIVYVRTPAGQLSWHVAAADLQYFEDVDVATPDDPAVRWDGHSTEEKYARLRRLTNKECSP
jgi:hypothetical protein